MSVEKVRHHALPTRGLEICEIQDGHGRRKIIQIPLLHPDPDGFIAKEMAEFEEQERVLAEKLEARFNPETLHKK